MNIHKGDIVQFYDTNSIFSKVIQLYNRLKFGERGPTHTGMVVRNSGNEVEIIEATAKGSIVTVISKELLKQEIFAGNIAIQRQNKTKNFSVTDVMLIHLKYLGVPYGYFDILGIATRFLFGFTPKLVKFFKGKKMLICSELVVRALYDLNKGKVDFEEEYGIPFDFITPMHIYKSKQVHTVEQK